MEHTVEEAAHAFAESRSSGSLFPAYYQGFIAGAQWAMKSEHNKTKHMRIKDSNKKQTVEEAAEECRIATAKLMGLHEKYHSIDDCPEDIFWGCSNMSNYD